MLGLLLITGTGFSGNERTCQENKTLCNLSANFNIKTDTSGTTPRMANGSNVPGSSFNRLQGNSTRDLNSSFTDQGITDSLFKMKEEDFVYAFLTLISSSLSVLGCIGFVFVFYYYKDLQTCSRRLLVYLSLADLLTAIGNIMGVTWLLCRSSSSCKYIYESVAFCKMHASLTIFSSISSFFWMIVIGICLMTSIIRSNPSFATTHMTLFHFTCWPLPGTIAIIALGTNVIGYDKNIASWCWIDPNTPNVLLWQFFTGKLWEISTYIVTVVIYSTVKVFLWRKSRTSLAKSKKKSRKIVLQEANRKLTFIPCVFIVFRIWGTLRFLLGSAAHYDKPWIAYLQGFGDSIQGFANFFLYCCLTDKIKQRFLSSVCSRHQQFSEHVSATTSRHMKNNTVDVVKEPTLKEPSVPDSKY